MANAEPAATAESEVKPPSALSYFRGSSVSYGHSLTATTITADPQYPAAYRNPTWAHKLELVPELHVGEQFFVRARLMMAQEFTESDSTTRRHEIELSDLGFETGVAGWKIPVVGIHVAGNVRLTAPTSKVSQGKTMVLSVGPAVAISKRFSLLSGLSLSYAGRYTYRFHRSTGAQTLEQPLQGCIGKDTPECLDLYNTGRRNAHSEITHGPGLSFAPLDVLSVGATFQMVHSFLYPVAPTDVSSNQLGPQAATDNWARFMTVFDLSVSWQMFKPIGLSLGASTPTPGLVPQGQNLFVLFNRNTTLYLDATVDIEAAVKGILGDPT